MGVLCIGCRRDFRDRRALTVHQRTCQGLKARVQISCDQLGRNLTRAKEAKVPRLDDGLEQEVARDRELIREEINAVSCIEVYRWPSTKSQQQLPDG